MYLSTQLILNYNGGLVYREFYNQKELLLKQEEQFLNNREFP